MGLIDIDNRFAKPKYKQIVSSIENGLLKGILKKGDKLPSINSIRNEYAVSRDTVLQAYNELKIRGVVQSVSGKGYYVKNENISTKEKVFLLFDELNVFKEDLYNAFLNGIDENVQVDIFFHHFNHEMFSKLIYDNIGYYNYYIIMPANLKNTKKIIENLPHDKVYILDQINKELSDYQGIYQNFEKDIFNGLLQALDLIGKYKKLVFLYQEKKQPKGLLTGFYQFCKKTNFKNEVVDSLETRIPEKGEIYLIPDNRNLILIIKKIRDSALIIGKDIGIIAYNDSLIKEVVEGGITTITTDFIEMGAKLAMMLKSKKPLGIENKSKLIIRKSL